MSETIRKKCITRLFQNYLDGFMGPNCASEFAHELCLACEVIVTCLGEEFKRIILGYDSHHTFKGIKEGLKYRLKSRISGTKK